MLTPSDIRRIVRDHTGDTERDVSEYAAAQVAVNANVGEWAIVRMWVVGLIGRADEPAVTEAIEREVVNE